MIKPCDLGMPNKFKDWRVDQYPNVRKIAFSNKRFIALNGPTGTGKTVTYVAAGKLHDNEARNVYTTSTIALGEQIETDFNADVFKGQANFRCIESPRHTCKTGGDAGCSARGTKSCPFRANLNTALVADDLTTNYAAFLHYRQKLGPFDYQVLDEFHDVPEQLANFVKVELTVEDVYETLGTTFLAETATLQDWRSWAAEQAPQLDRLVIALKASLEDSPQLIPQLSRAMDLKQALVYLAGSRTDWVISRGARSVSFDPVDTSRFGHLLYSAPKIVCASATLSPKTLELAGVTDTETTWIDVESPFSVDRQRIHYVPRGAWKFDSDDAEIDDILRAIGNIVARRLDRRGIIHSVSYSRGELIAKALRAKFRDAELAVYAPSGRQLRDQIDQFKYGRKNAVLIAPSVTTGYDFPDGQCRYQIIPKLPYPDMRSEVMKRRARWDRQYAAYLAVQSVVQMCGRAMRSNVDWCETIILDRQFGWCWDKYRDKLAPKWFHRFVRAESRDLPDPMAGFDDDFDESEIPF